MIQQYIQLDLEIQEITHLNLAKKASDIIAFTKINEAYETTKPPPEPKAPNKRGRPTLDITTTY